MLVLNRQIDESIMIGDDVEVTIVDIREDIARIGINCPKSIPVHRKEIYDAIQKDREKRAEKPEKREGVAGEFKAEEAKPAEGLLFFCSGAYEANKPQQDAYLRFSESDKRLQCGSLRADGYCSFFVDGDSPSPLKKCPLGIEKFLE